MDQHELKELEREISKEQPWKIPMNYQAHSMEKIFEVRTIAMCKEKSPAHVFQPINWSWCNQLESHSKSHPCKEITEINKADSKKIFKVCSTTI